MTLGVVTAIGIIASWVIGLMFDKLERHLKTIADVAVSVQGDIESIRSDMASMSSEITYLRNRLAPTPKWDDDDSTP